MGVFVVHDPEWVQRDQRTSWPSTKGSKISFSVTRSILIYSLVASFKDCPILWPLMALVTSSMSPGWWWRERGYLAWPEAIGRGPAPLPAFIDPNQVARSSVATILV